MLRTEDAVSPTLPGGHVLASLVMFSALYALLGALWIVLTVRLVRRGPEPAPAPGDAQGKEAAA